jgi:gamma-glutamylcyclotransferase (GGCT)/AIG2-like uncharacterized protein YtfP
MEADGIFVYDSLRKGGRNHAWLDRTNPEGCCAAWTPGRLFHLPMGGFPALVAGPDPGTPPPGPGWVAGEFVGYESDEDLEAALADLDQIEDVEGGLYVRRVVLVVLDSGHRYGAWAYLFESDRLIQLERGAGELLDGDWSSYLGD